MLEKTASRHNQRKQTVNSDNKCTFCRYNRRSTRDDACPAIGAECRKYAKNGHVSSVSLTKDVDDIKTVP